ncbi:MAG: vancomycin high temperature exclusion protein, partial [Anaerolineales bacterium]
MLRVLIFLTRLTLLAALLAGLIALPRAWAVRRFTDRIHSLASLPKETRQAAVVFGAGLRWDGRPTAILADRVAAAARLYEEGLVDQLILSGTQQSDGYDEPAAMAEMALALGVPAEAIILDGAGTRTIETCRRMVNIFDVSSAYLVTQNYHLPRALATCHALGLPADGVSADLRSYRAEDYYRLREIPAT